MNGKKSLMIILTLLMIFTMVLTACGGTATEAPEVEEPEVEEPVVDEPVAEEPAEEAMEESAVGKPSGKLVVWVQQANQDVWEQTILPGFQEEYPFHQNSCYLILFLKYKPTQERL